MAQQIAHGTSSPVTGEPIAACDPAPHKSAVGALALGSLGVVFGDIGTSPLYALRESLNHMKTTGVTDGGVLGTVSLLLWALFFTVTAKYVLFLMRADNKGEGGTLSLMALAQSALGHRAAAVFFLGVAGAALFSGDAIITPAISVLSALEGLELVTPIFTPYILPATIVILISIFWVQSHGTARVATFFGPIMAVFFLTMGVLGAMHIHDSPRILLAFDPIYGLRFLFGHGLIGFVVLGSVFLAVTGAEALYADMGHFGRRPIQGAWLFFVLPALTLNYLGQGALVLATPAAVENPFFLMAPPWALLPLVILSTVATIIASQAVITGAFSLARQAIQLGLLPRMLILHTSETQEGQIYIPRINRLLLVGVLLLVLMFKSSSSLASAYGIAVTGTMVVTTSLAFVVVWKLWHWPLWLAALFISGFLAIDLAFLAANLLKIVDGGWVPLLLGGFAMVVMWTWVRGADLLARKTRRDSISMQDLIRMLEKSKPIRVAGTAVFLTTSPEVAPSAFMHNLKHNKVMHERVLLMSVKTGDTPRVPQARRFEITKLSDDFTSIVLNYGYMESPRIPAALASLRKAGLKFDIMTTSFFVGRRKIKPAQNSGMPVWQDRLFIALFRQSANPTDYFSIPSDRVVELGEQLTI
ncbi:putative potassium transport system protein kup 2 [Methylocella tundrae]|uniref:Probable potassium transport system protein Kup n=1 Tax=Methylocella tundrae TaxID=227605 RepID=A0A8B6LZL1_METTU|nr:potassium transporter Kup [Methylocella tundrae]VTZ22831.1 putative potassium transport system protein kup 2 [Methylocella tundrae]VTZ48211.1 putative potassium transport system protein kup 2 [Methylocella tundrae]